MTRHVMSAALAALACASCVVPGTTYLGFSTGVAPGPPPAVVVVEPAVAPVGAGVYVVTDPAVGYDMFRFGTTWYLYSGSYWYRAGSYRGPFAAVDVRYVPREVVTVPPGHWKRHPHGGPPGHQRHRGRES